MAEFVASLFIVGLLTTAIAKLVIQDNRVLPISGTALVAVCGAGSGGVFAMVLMNVSGHGEAFHSAGLIGGIVASALSVLAYRRSLASRAAHSAVRSLIESSRREQTNDMRSANAPLGPAQFRSRFPK